MAIVGNRLFGKVDSIMKTDIQIAGGRVKKH